MKKIFKDIIAFIILVLCLIIFIEIYEKYSAIDSTPPDDENGIVESVALSETSIIW